MHNFPTIRKIQILLIIIWFLRYLYAQNITFSAVTTNSFENTDILNAFVLMPLLSSPPNQLYFNDCGVRYVGGSDVFYTGLYNYAHIEFLNIPPHYMKQITFTLYKAQTASNNFYMNLGTIGQNPINYYYLSNPTSSCEQAAIYEAKVFNIIDNLDSNCYIDLGITYDSSIKDIFGFRDFEVSFFTCISNCLACSDGTTCNTCDTSKNYGLQGLSQCLICPSGTYANSLNSLCTTCVNPCKTCNGLTAFNCLSCVPGYYFTGTSCICHSSCLTCSGPNQNQCLSCLSPSVLNVNACNAACVSGTYLETSINSCLSCVSPCSICNGLTTSNCLSCINGYYISGSVCIMCDITCLSCFGSSLNQCLSCLPTLVLNVNTCITACPFGKYLESISNACLSCLSPCSTCNGLTTSNCLSCINGYYISGSVCIMCDITCLTCFGSSQNQCLSCLPPLVLNANACITACPFGKYLESISNACLSCLSPCSTCNGLTTSNCLSCINGYYISGSVCIMCDITCLTCFGSNLNQCLSCLPPLVLNVNICITACPVGKYLESISNSCLSCLSPCLNCNGLTTSNCLSCVPGYYFTGTSCICHSSCLQCDGPNQNQCLSCLSPLVLNINTCDSTCNSGTYLDLTINSCISCKNPCKTCNGLSSDCLSCISGYYLSGNTCTLCHITCLTCSGPNYTQCLSCLMPLFLNMNICIAACNASSYMDNTIGICIPCQNPCQTCNGTAINCLSCSDGYYLIKNLCIICDVSCLTCIGPINSQCTSCDNLHMLQNGYCVSQCNQNTYLDTVNRICIDCDTSCKTCFNSDQLSCNSCYTGSFLYENSCLNLCPLSFYEVIENNTCQAVEKINLNLNFTNNNTFYLELCFQKTYSGIDLNYLNTHMNLQIIEGTNKNNISSTILPNPSNNLSYYIFFSNPSINYPSNTYLNVTFNSPLDKTVRFTNNSYYLSMNSMIFCPLDEYYDMKSHQCEGKLKLYYSVWYTDEPYIILLQFNSMTTSIQHSILQGLMIFQIDNMSPGIDYNYTLKLDSLNVYVIFSFAISVTGGKYLHTLMNQTLYNPINYLDNKTYLNNQNSSIKLMEYYLLSESELLIINRTGSSIYLGNMAMNSLLYLNLVLIPTVLSPIIGILLLNIIEMLKYIEIEYPPNARMIFKTTDFNFFSKTDFFDEFNSNLPPLLAYYNIKNYIFDNLAESLIILFTCFLISMLTKLSFFCKPKRNIILKVLNYIKQRFIWNILVTMFLSKYMNTCFFYFIYLRYESNMSITSSNAFLVNFIIQLFCFFYVVLFPLHIYKTVKNLISIIDTENKLTTIDIKFCQTSVVNTIDLKKNAVYPMFTDQDENEPQGSPNHKIIPSKNIINDPIEEQNIIKENNENQPSNNIDVINENSQKIEPKSEKNEKSIEIIDNKIVYFNNNVEIFISESNVPTASSNEILMTLKSSMKSTINWKNFNEYVTPQLRPLDPIKKEDMMSLSVDFTNNAEKNDGINESPKDDLKSKKVILSKFKNLDIKTLDNSPNKQKKVLDSTPLYNPNNIKSNDNKRKFNSIGIFLLRICSKIKNLVNFDLNIYKVKDSIEYKNKYRVLCKDFHKSQFLYNILFDIARFIIIPFIIITLFGFNMLQISILNTMNFIMLAYIALKMPYTRKQNTIVALINEFCIFTSYGSAFLLVSLGQGDLSIQNKMNLGWIIVFAYIFLLYFLIANTIFRMLKGCFCKRNKFENKILANNIN